MQADDRRYINFPLVLLSETITEPGAGMNRLSSKVIADYAQHCRPDAAAAVVQLAYAVRGKETLPQGLQRVTRRQAFVECVESLDDCWGGSGDEFEETAKDIFGDPTEMFSEDELSEIVNWCSLRRSADFFGRRINNFGGLQATAKAVQKTVDQHESDHGAICMTSIPVDFFNECQNQAGNIESMRVFRMVCAVRSVVGTKRWAGTTKRFIAARMIGAKKPAVADAMATSNEPLTTELNAMHSRKRFDRIFTDAAIRGFFTKLGAGRSIYISTVLQTPVELAAAVNQRKTKQRESYAAKERAARDTIGAARGQHGGSIGGSYKQDVLIKALETRHSNKGDIIKRRHHLAGGDVSSISPNSIHPETEVTQ